MSSCKQHGTASDTNEEHQGQTIRVLHVRPLRRLFHRRWARNGGRGPRCLECVEDRLQDGAHPAHRMDGFRAARLEVADPFGTGLCLFLASMALGRGTFRRLGRTRIPEKFPARFPVLLTIRQTFGQISCVMRTAEMTSRSYCADFWIDNDEQVRKLAYCYTSVPSVLIPDRSQPHDGAMLFEIIGEPAQKQRGNYWTTRKTTGEVTLTFRCRERLEDLPGRLRIASDGR